MWPQVAQGRSTPTDPLAHSPILLQPAEEIRVIQHDAVFIHRKFRVEATSVQVLEKVEALGQPRIGLRPWLNRQLGREDPGHAELPALAYSHRLAANREAVGEGGRPDIDIDAAIE